MAIADRQGLPVAVHVESAMPHEVTLVHATLAQQFVNQLPVRLIGDNAYESDRLDAELARRGVELIAPHRRTRTQRTQDGRPLRRYQRRWKVERLFAWFQNFRRSVERLNNVPKALDRFRTIPSTNAAINRASDHLLELAVPVAHWPQLAERLDGQTRGLLLLAVTSVR